MLPNGPDWPSCLDGSLKSHRGISIFLIFLWSYHQVGMKKVLKTSSDFFCYFKASDSYCVRFKGAKRNEQTGISWLVYLSNSFHYPQPQPRINSMHQGNELFWVQLANPVTQCHRHWWWHWRSSSPEIPTISEICTDI